MTAISQLHVTTRPLWAPKAGNRVEEYEDAYWPERWLRRRGNRLRFAVADGATETSFSALWAQQWVQCYGVGGCAPTRFDDSLAQEQAQWLQTVRSKPLPWYAEEKALSGAYAALIGLELLATRDGRLLWQALALGDCCLAQVRHNELITFFPAGNTTYFTNSPYLLSSNPARNHELPSALKRREGTTAVGDTFYLMSDALAHWFLGAYEAKVQPWRAFERVTASPNARRFHAWIDDLRATHLLRNDDVTLLEIKLRKEEDEGLGSTSRP
ncbi:MAG: hypothetical protein IPK16_28925 [Anaerolineales bacterium]|nr:hypothetical protein [Anaerolineales bacterium]